MGNYFSYLFHCEIFYEFIEMLRDEKKFLLCLREIAYDSQSSITSTKRHSGKRNVNKNEKNTIQRKISSTHNVENESSANETDNITSGG